MLDSLMLAAASDRGGEEYMEDDEAVVERGAMGTGLAPAVVVAAVLAGGPGQP